jgi:hypothetical protein
MDELLRELGLMEDPFVTERRHFGKPSARGDTA